MDDRYLDGWMDGSIGGGDSRWAREARPYGEGKGRGGGDDQRKVSMVQRLGF